MGVDSPTDLVRLALVGLVGGLFGSFLGNRNYRRQRWWERRADAYTRLIDALSDLLSYYSALTDAEMMRTELTKEREAELEAPRKETRRHVVRATMSGAYFFSEEVAISLRALEKHQDTEYDSAFEHYDSNWGANRECLDRVAAASKRDLQTSWPRWMKRPN